MKRFINRFFIATSLLIGMLLLQQHAKHPLHISVTNVEYSKNTNVLQVTVKLFHDDFQTIVQRLYGVQLQLGTNNQHSDYKEYCTKYIAQHIDFKINNKKIDILEMELVEDKMNHEAIWFTYQTTYKNKLKTIAIQNTLMTDMFADQSNLLFIVTDKQQLATKLDYKNNTYIVKY